MNILIKPVITEKMTDEDLAAVDTAALAKEHAEKANKKKDEAERKVREASKKLDYVVRAARIEELPLIKARNEEKIKAEREKDKKKTTTKKKGKIAIASNKGTDFDDIGLDNHSGGSGWSGGGGGRDDDYDFM